MQKNKLIRVKETIYRILEMKEESVLVINCIKRTMPKWRSITELEGYVDCSEEELLHETGMILMEVDDLNAKQKCFVHKYYTMIAGILPFIGDKKMKNQMIALMAENSGVSKRTVGNYLCLYLVFQDLSVFAPAAVEVIRAFTKDEKNMRWALNKFFYNHQKNSLQTAYTMMLKEKYCDAAGKLLSEYPTIHQFKYFYRKHKNMQKYYISRNGLKNYQRNNRPLLGDGIQEYASSVGMGMLDATICDIYLINEAGNLIGRPILTACIDAFSSLCCGYMLSWEGGTYSLRGLMINILSNKVEWCKKHGVFIEKEQWDSDKLPGILVTDMGAEYKSETFEQIAEVGVTVVNLPSYRPELKGAVEKFFDLIQDTYKKHLKGRGVIEPDFQERGSHDYRKDACLTMREFEKIIIRCIIYYNTQRIIENFPYTEEMLINKIQPYANEIYEWGRKLPGANLIEMDVETVVLVLLPRTIGRFSRKGLIVNKMRYKNPNFIERYLIGGTAKVAYNPENVSCVWLVENGSYIPFELIESRFEGRELSAVEGFRKEQKLLIQGVRESNTQAQIDLANFIETVLSHTSRQEDTDVKGIRNNRKREQDRSHQDYMKGGL